MIRHTRILVRFNRRHVRPLIDTPAVARRGAPSILYTGPTATAQVTLDNNRRNWIHSSLRPAFQPETAS
ncbi:hypothetical protein [Caulobacter segnis]|uniref:hypothetical protein n=1 Tax=Caulobacter segnis TaxID=88688 RepID=UPI001CBB093D|nr:hypothetical protein [Caulobacter segnis]UAL13151.1 hypothetical protein K8940_05300 [Caulobacter segnis]